MRYKTTNDSPAPDLRGTGDHSWHPRGACHGMDPARADKLFFHTVRDRRSIAEAKRMCATCPVKKDCFNYAIDHQVIFGIWGGLTDKERQQWLKKRSERLDYERVRATLQGRDVPLSTAERSTVIHQLCLRGWSPERVAHRMNADLDWTRDLMREAARAVETRDLYWGLVEEHDGKLREPHPDDPDEQHMATHGREVQSHALISSLGKAA
ncbi:WhiB family transcriptional regulator [Streptomyces sp. TLI_146]|uniref:WhiB family transcriptional regulator n=1 Tax=Streptomyces sp. TLI_146 TaxID=1938858 RepID=UPI000C70E8BF|nr:WhiB family transcriptional regulator [Streptomyces sp. TLI_146]PKV84250.1 WhiB family redox-sensing transcriptional regulator [Streptomyces sp. TLI_146]